MGCLVCKQDTEQKAEQRYCVTRSELPAVVAFTQHFRNYLLGRESVLRTGHGSLTWLQSFKEPEGQLARWLQKRQEINFLYIARERAAQMWMHFPDCHASSVKEKKNRM